MNDLQIVLEALVDVNKKWKKLGLALGLKKPTIERIKADYGNDTEECKEEMLTLWLRGVDGCTPSWNDLVDALRNQNVQHADIAGVIEKEYL